MINQIYIENEIKDHPRVQSILKKFKRNTPIYIDKYASVLIKKIKIFASKKNTQALYWPKKAGYVLKTPLILELEIQITFISLICIIVFMIVSTVFFKECTLQLTKSYL